MHRICIQFLHNSITQTNKQTTMNPTKSPIAHTYAMLGYAMILSISIDGKKRDWLIWIKCINFVYKLVWNEWMNILELLLKMMMSIVIILGLKLGYYRLSIWIWMSREVEKGQDRGKGKERKGIYNKKKKIFDLIRLYLLIDISLYTYIPKKERK